MDEKNPDTWPVVQVILTYGGKRYIGECRVNPREKLDEAVLSGVGALALDRAMAPIKDRLIAAMAAMG